MTITRNDLRIIFKNAWGLARYLARKNGVSVRLMFADALRQAWARQKQVAASIAIMKSNVLAEVERMKESARARRNQPRIIGRKGGQWIYAAAA